jgi:hypothetical protein
MKHGKMHNRHRMPHRGSFLQDLLAYVGLLHLNSYFTLFCEKCYIIILNLIIFEKEKFMGKHVLYMLNPWTKADGQGPFYCPDCGVVEGFLAYSPEVRSGIEIIHVAYQRPRSLVVEALGEENQGSPVLVLADGTDLPEGAKKSFSTGRYFIDDAIGICDFLGEIFNAVRPHP